MLRMPCKKTQWGLVQINLPWLIEDNISVILFWISLKQRIRGSMFIKKQQQQEQKTWKYKKKFLRHTFYI